MNKFTKVKLVFLVILCFVLMCGFTSKEGVKSDVETVNFTYITDKLPKGGEVLLTMYESKSNTKYNGFVTSDGTSSQIKIKVSAEPFKSNITSLGVEWYNCYALVNITPECKEKLTKGQLIVKKVNLDSKSCQNQKSEKVSKREIKKVQGVIVIAIGYAIILSKVTGRRKKED